MQKIKSFLAYLIPLWQVIICLFLASVILSCAFYREHKRIIDFVHKQDIANEKRYQRLDSIVMDGYDYLEKVNKWLEQDSLQKAHQQQLTSDSLTNKFKKRWKTKTN